MTMSRRCIVLLVHDVHISLAERCKCRPLRNDESVFQRPVNRHRADHAVTQQEAFGIGKYPAERNRAVSLSNWASIAPILPGWEGAAPPVSITRLRPPCLWPASPRIRDSRSEARSRNRPTSRCCRTKW